MKGNNLCVYLGEEHPRQREAPVQRPWGSTVSSIFEAPHRNQCVWHRVSKGHVVVEFEKRDESKTVLKFLA